MPGLRTAPDESGFKSSSGALSVARRFIAGWRRAPAVLFVGEREGAAAAEAKAAAVPPAGLCRRPCWMRGAGVMVVDGPEPLTSRPIRGPVGVPGPLLPPPHREKREKGKERTTRTARTARTNSKTAPTGSPLPVRGWRGGRRGGQGVRALRRGRSEARQRPFSERLR